MCSIQYHFLFFIINPVYFSRRCTLLIIFVYLIFIIRRKYLLSNTCSLVTYQVLLPCYSVERTLHLEIGSFKHSVILWISTYLSISEKHDVLFWFWLKHDFLFLYCFHQSFICPSILWSRMDCFYRWLWRDINKTFDSVV